MMQRTLATSGDKKQLFGSLARPLQTILWVLGTTLFTLVGLVMIVLSVIVVVISPLVDWQKGILSSLTRRQAPSQATTRSTTARELNTDDAG